jgi:hypothetical protein
MHLLGLGAPQRVRSSGNAVGPGIINVMERPALERIHPPICTTGGWRLCRVFVRSSKIAASIIS